MKNDKSLPRKFFEFVIIAFIFSLLGLVILFFIYTGGNMVYEGVRTSLDPELSYKWKRVSGYITSAELESKRGEYIGPGYEIIHDENGANFISVISVNVKFNNGLKSETHSEKIYFVDEEEKAKHAINWKYRTNYPIDLYILIDDPNKKTINKPEAPGAVGAFFLIFFGLIMTVPVLVGAALVIPRLIKEKTEP